MNKFLLLLLFVITITFSNCDSSKQLAKTVQTANQAYSNGDYTTALNLWEQVIADYKQKGEEKQCPVFTDAGMAAQKLGQTDKAIEYLKQAIWSEFSKEETYLTLAEIYRQNDNLSLELVNLETYLNKYPTGSKINDVKKGLFELYVESDNSDKALNIWNNLSPEQQDDVNLLVEYLKINDKLKNNDTCLVVSQKILKLDKNSIPALHWLSNFYFWKAEKRYQLALKAYDNHKTRKQYKILLKELDVVTGEFKKSLGYANRLYQLNKNPKTAGLLSKIYNRLDDKQKSNYYKQLSKK